MPVLKLFWSALTILMLCGSGAVRAESAEQLFARFEPALLQIRVLDQASGAKAAIGTGFLLAEPALLVTNYHVISEAVLYPAKHRLEYLNSAQQKGELKVLAVDVIEHPERGFLVNEINHTMEFHTTQPLTGVDIGGTIVDYVLKTAQGKGAA